jgi:lipopolysaccharide biosynthesis glycosyltransferase
LAFIGLGVYKKSIIMAKEYHICCITDDKYAQHCAVMLCSLFEKNKDKIFCIHILTTTLNEDTKQKLSNMVQSYHSTCIFHRVDEAKLKGVQLRKKVPNYATYFKLLLSSVIDEEINIVLYLDSDIVINGEITPIFELDIDKYALAAVEDAPIEYAHRMQLSLPCDAKYFNAGVMLVNLAYWRKNDSENHLLAFAKKERFVFYHDQDALNVVFQGQWFSLSPIWNKFNMYPWLCIPPRFDRWEDTFLFKKYPIVIHYVGLRPWFNLPFIPYGKLYRKFLYLTPWKDVKFQNKSKCGGGVFRIFLHLCRKTPLWVGLVWILRFYKSDISKKHIKLN